MMSYTDKVMLGTCMISEAYVGVGVASDGSSERTHLGQLENNVRIDETAVATEQ